jgi:hypothetical protein
MRCLVLKGKVVVGIYEVHHDDIWELALCPSHYTPRERTRTHWTEGWVDPKDGLNAVAKRKT